MKSKRTPAADLETIMPLLISVWRSFQKLSGPKDKLQTNEFRTVVEAIKKLKLKEESTSDEESSDKASSDYFQDRDLLGAYLLYPFALHYQEALSVIGELPSAPKRVLDVCSGPGSFAFAALRHGASEVIAIDQNNNALRIGAEVMGRYGVAITTRTSDVLKKELPVEGKFDLITLGHSLRELFPSNKKGFLEEQHQFIQKLLERLTPEGFLIIVENSYKLGNERLLKLRDRLVREGVPVEAPCLFKGDCPALKTANSPCYAQRELEKPYLLREIQRAADIRLSSLKFSYIIFKSPKANWREIPEGHFYRVISPPVAVQQKKRFYLCGSDGKKMLESRFKTHPDIAKAFDYLRRGELISIENANEKLNIFEVNEETSLKNIATCGKPVPFEEF